MLTLERRQNEIDELLNECADAEVAGSTKFPGMTYEQGLKAAIDWLTDSRETYPLAD